MSHITLDDARNEPLDARLFSDATPQPRAQPHTRAAVVDTTTPLHPRTTYRVTLGARVTRVVVERMTVVDGPDWALGRAWARAETWYRQKGATITCLDAA